MCNWWPAAMWVHALQLQATFSFMKRAVGYLQQQNTKEIVVSWYEVDNRVAVVIVWCVFVTGLDCVACLDGGVKLHFQLISSLIQRCSRGCYRAGSLKWSDFSQIYYWWQYDVEKNNSAFNWLDRMILNWQNYTHTTMCIHSRIPYGYHKSVHIAAVINLN